jgi:hypothetical protein
LKCSEGKTHSDMRSKKAVVLPEMMNSTKTQEPVHVLINVLAWCIMILVEICSYLLHLCP